MEDKNKIYFPNLDGLRFFSFLVVFMAHSLSTRQQDILQSSWYQIVKIRMFSDGEIGVSFFFVLSGFLITYLLLEEIKQTNTIQLIAFYIRRALRIWPLYFFCVFFGFIVFPILKSKFGQVPHETADPLLCSLFMNNFNGMINGMPDSSVLAVLWSVAIEEQFYLIWPLIFVFYPRQYFIYAFVLVIIVSLLYRCFFPYDDLHTLSVISDMAIGGLAAFLVLKKDNQFIQLIERSNPLMNLLPYVLIVIFLLFKHEIFSNYVLLVFKRVIMALVFAWVILEQNFCKNSYFKISNLKTISYLGRYTYGLYCLHTIAILITVVLMSKLDLNQYTWQLLFVEIPVSLGLSVLISYISYHWYEKRFLILKKKFQIVKSQGGE